METTKQNRITYDPQRSRMIVENNGRTFGFVGKIAEEKFIESLESGIDVIITDMSDNNERKRKIRVLRAIWIKLGIDDMRESILEPYGVKSTADLTLDQLNELLRGFSDNNNRNETSKPVRDMRSRVLVQLQELGVYNNDRNWDHVNNFLLDKRVAGKKLYEMTLSELKALEIKLRSIVAKHLKAVAEADRLKRMN